MKLSNILSFYAFPKRHVIQFSPVRTGSTIIYNLLRECLPDKTVTKAHTYCRHFGHLPLVATTRHPLDCISSMIQVKNAQPDDETIRSTVERFYANGGTDLIRIKNERKILLLRYEEFVDDYEPVFSSFEAYFGISISSDKRADLTAKYNIESTKKIAASQDGFATWDPVTKIHGQHISKFGGRPFAYKKYFTDPQIDLLKSLCEDYMSTFDYD
ncbi:MAG TPA: hypothetical protein VL357_06395 [Rariglobus sp.]|jgi:hypothetical protein|nr:hypothetical protein [Rariglobus sp.]